MSETTMRFVIAASGDAAEATVRSFGDTVSSVTRSFVTNGIAIAAAYAVFNAGKTILEDSVKTAEAAQVSQAQLARAIEVAGGSWAAYQPQVVAADDSMQNFGYTNAQTQTALATLTTGLGDPAKALSVLSVAADLARAKNMDLNAAALLVTKGMEGQTKPLKALGIDIPVYASSSQTVALAQQKLATAQENVNLILAKTPGAVNASSSAHAQYERAVEAVTAAQTALTDKQNSGQVILDAISAKFKGAAATAADTYQGHLQALNAKVDDVEEKIGNKLLPVLDDVVTWIDKYGIPKLDDFVSGWDRVTAGMDRTAKAGAVVREMIQEIIDAAQTGGQIGANVWDWLQGTNFGPGPAAAALAASQADQKKVLASLAQQQAAHPGVVAGSPNGTVGNTGLLPSPTYVQRSLPPSNAAGGTYAARAGGVLVRMSEAGRSETIVDTATLNKAMKQRSGGNQNITIYQQRGESSAELTQKLGFYLGQVS